MNLKELLEYADENIKHPDFRATSCYVDSTNLFQGRTAIQAKAELAKVIEEIEKFEDFKKNLKRILEDVHTISLASTEMCRKIEEAGCSPQLTELSIKAASLSQQIRNL